MTWVPGPQELRPPLGGRRWRSLGETVSRQTCRRKGAQHHDCGHAGDHRGVRVRPGRPEAVKKAEDKVAHEKPDAARRGERAKASPGQATGPKSCHEGGLQCLYDPERKTER